MSLCVSAAQTTFFVVSVLCIGWALGRALIEVGVYVSEYAVLYTLSMLVVWLFLDHFEHETGRTYKKQVDTGSFDVTQRFIVALSVQVQNLTDRNHALTQSLMRFNGLNLAALRWNIVHHKAMSFYYMKQNTHDISREGRHMRRAISELLIHSSARHLLPISHEASPIHDTAEAVGSLCVSSIPTSSPHPTLSAEVASPAEPVPMETPPRTPVHEA
jgi:hypothetical protein